MSGKHVVKVLVEVEVVDGVDGQGVVKRVGELVHAWAVGVPWVWNTSAAPAPPEVVCDSKTE